MQKFDFDSEKDLDRLAMMYEMTLDEPERIPEPKTEHPYVPSFLSAEAHIKRIREKAAERDAEVETSESENDVSIEDVDDSIL